jgi:uncharacterized delta-60 repeat protein
MKRNWLWEERGAGLWAVVLIAGLVAGAAFFFLHRTGSLPGGLSPAAPSRNATGSFSHTPAWNNNTEIKAILALPDGRTVIGGRFEQCDGVNRPGLARLLEDGRLDNSFVPALVPGEAVNALALQSDGKIIVALSAGPRNPPGKSRLLRLNPDGGADAGFDTSSYSFGRITALAAQRDGRILVAGDMGGGFARGLNRFMPSGRIDPGFTPTTSLIEVIDPQPDGKILIAGIFDPPLPGGSMAVLRLKADGTRDGAFRALGDMGRIHSVARQQDGRILVGGSFQAYGGIPRNGSFRLNPDGSLDEEFNPTIRARGLLPLPDGKILAYGPLGEYGVRDIRRLLPDGRADAAFTSNLPQIMNREFTNVVLQPNGDLLVGSVFISPDGVPRADITRLHIAP